MSAEHADRAASLLERLVRRVGVYVEDDQLRRSRVDRVLATLGLDDDARAEIDQRFVTALEAAGVVLVDDVSDTDTAGSVPTQRRVEAQLEAEPATPPTGARIDLDHAKGLAMALLTDRDRRPGRGRRHLSAAEEIGLAALMRGDRYDLGADLPEDFRARADAGSVEAQAFDTLILMNTGLVWSSARKHINDARSDLSVDDLAGYGTLGLIRAVRKFDASRGFKFSTYAMNWIEQQIQRGMMDFGRTIRLPVHLQEKMQRTRKAYATLQLRGLAATPLRLAAETGFELDEIVRHLQYFRGVVSLDVAVGEDGSAFLGQFITVESTGPDPVADLLIQERRRVIENLLDAVLKEREASVLRYRFGFVTGEPMTLDEIGKVFSVTRERIRQIESRALGKLQQAKEVALIA